MEQIKGFLRTYTKSLRSSLYTNAVYLWLGQIAFAILGFAFWTVVARSYCPEEVGLGGTAVASLLVLAQVSQLGLGYALVRFIRQSGSDAPLLLSRSLMAAAVASILIGTAFLSALPLWSQDLKGLLLRPIPGGSFLAFVVLITVTGLLRFTFIAYRRSVFVLALNLVNGTLRLPLVVLLGGLGSAMGIVAGFGLAVPGGILLAALVFLPRCIGRLRLPLALDLWRLAPLAPFALSNLASHVLTGLVQSILPLLIIALAGAERAGFFYIAWAVAGLVLGMTQQLALALFAEGSADMRGFASQVWRSLLVGVALGGLFAVVVFLVGDLVLLLFGREYVEQSSGVLKVLAAATPLAAVTNIYLGVERVRGRMVLLMAVSALVAVVMLVVTVVLVPRLGIVGAGYGALAGYGIGAMVSLYLLYPMMRDGRGHTDIAGSRKIIRGDRDSRPR